MKKQRKFLVAGSLVAGMVGYLMVTGVQDSMAYYHTPTELVMKVASDPSYFETGVKVGARVVPGSVHYDNRTLDLTFEVVDIENGNTRFPVAYTGVLPDTFTDQSDVVLEGRMTREGVFAAATILTKCGSRYEAGIEDFAT